MQLKQIQFHTVSTCCFSLIYRYTVGVADYHSIKALKMKTYKTQQSASLIIGIIRGNFEQDFFQMIIAHNQYKQIFNVITLCSGSNSDKSLIIVIRCKFTILAYSSRPNCSDEVRAHLIWRFDSFVCGVVLLGESLTSLRPSSIRAAFFYLLEFGLANASLRDCKSKC